MPRRAAISRLLNHPVVQWFLLKIVDIFSLIINLLTLFSKYKPNVCATYEKKTQNSFLIYDLPLFYVSKTGRDGRCICCILFESKVGENKSQIRIYCPQKKYEKLEKICACVFVCVANWHLHNHWDFQFFLERWFGCK